MQTNPLESTATGGKKTKVKIYNKDPRTLKNTGLMFVGIRIHANIEPEWFVPHATFTIVFSMNESIDRGRGWGW